VSVSSSTTLAQLAQAINQAGSPVDAQVEKSGSGDYYLEMFDTKTGQSMSSSSDFSGEKADWADVGLLTSTSSGYTVNVVQQAQDAQISLGSNTYSSSTNTFSGVIPGVTIKALATGTSTIAVTTSTSSVLGSIKKAVDAWNAWAKNTEKLAFGAVPSSSGGGSSFGANPNQELATPVPMQVIDSLENILTSTTANGLSLGSIGITVSSSSPTFSINTASLSSALQNNLSGVQALFNAINHNNGTAFDTGITNFAGGGSSAASSRSVTQTAIANDKNQVTQMQSEITQYNAQITATDASALTEYQQFQQMLGSMAQTDEMLAALDKSSSSS
ncbi:MAG: flagellar filament capping protein FliD, partial [Firmicutes bacterium]|nr:flagellar filament capping protein FliD [Bacillota bacterium]